MNRTEMVAIAGEVGTTLASAQKSLDGLDEVIVGLLSEVDLKLDELEARTAYNNLLLHHLKKMIGILDHIGPFGQITQVEQDGIEAARRIAGMTPA